MEIEELDKENPVTPETADLQEKDLTDYDVNLDISIEVENSSLKGIDNDGTDVSVVQEINSENGKKKVKEEKPSSKIVVRRLPPTMTKEQFLEQVSPLPDIDYMYYVQGDVNNNVNPFSRAYLNFISPEDLFSFSRTFDNYVFLDSKGQEYPAVVEFSMFQRVPKQRPKKKDVLMGTIGSDPSFITFKENVLAEALEISKSGGKTMKQHYFETEISTTEEVNTTPLLEFLKVRRAERARIKEERREEKKRKDLERKLKHKTKDKKGEGDEEDTPKEMKVLPLKDRRDIRDNRTNKKKDDKDKVKETRAREFKSRGGKSYQEERLKLAERREEQRKLLLNSSEKKVESGEQNDETESVSSKNEQLKEGDKIIRIETRKFDNKRNGKYDNEEWKDDSKKRSRGDKKNIKRDGRERKDDYSRRHSEKRNNDSDTRRRTKSYKSSDFVKYDRKKNFELGNKSDSRDKSTEKNSSAEHNKSKSWDDLTVLFEGYGKTTTIDELLKDKKRSFSLDNSSLRSDGNNYFETTRNEVTFPRKKEKTHYKDSKGTEYGGYVRSRKDISNRRYLESKGNSKRKDRSDDKTEYAITSKGVENDYKDKDSVKIKDSSTRAERRIRNKDRPSIEIYRPGMGKFSKQRLEKEKALGSSTEIESPSHSPSPIPKSKLIS